MESNAPAISRMHLWLRWVAANALCEMLGLGMTFAVIGLAFSRLESVRGAWGALASFGLAVASGSLEATLVGLGQQWAMRPAFPTIPRTHWWGATLVGALAAYVLGYLPSTLMSLGEGAAQAQAVEPPQATILLLAAGMGAAAGALLSVAQWRVLRRHAPGAGAWVPANMLAWALGMPMIFWGMDLFFKFESPARGIPCLAAVLLLAGAGVGAVHGLFLVRLVRPAAQITEA